MEKTAAREGSGLFDCLKPVTILPFPLAVDGEGEVGLSPSSLPHAGLSEAHLPPDPIEEELDRAFGFDWWK
jgi:hypothetical protein